MAGDAVEPSGSPVSFGAGTPTPRRPSP